MRLSWQGSWSAGGYCSESEAVMSSQFPAQGGLAQLAGLLYSRRKVFISYHHGGDQWFYNEFSRLFHDQYETIFDNSLERQFDSEDARYVMQRIRDKHITNTSCTVVLIGAQTHQRKYVDWEIKATLDKDHGLVGIVLPTHQKSQDQKILVPDRFHDNVVSGYALWDHWSNMSVKRLTEMVHIAAGASSRLINNSRDMKQRNG